MKRWKQLNQVYLLVIGLIVFFAWMDSQQILTFFALDSTDAWNLYGQFTAPAIVTTWYTVLAVVALIWFIIYKDLSEALALYVGGWALIWFGVQDFFYFIWSGKLSYLVTEPIMCWMQLTPVTFIANLLGESCATTTSFILSIGVGIIVSYYLFTKLKEARW